MEPTASSLAIGSLGSLLPDIDTPKASLGRIFPLSFWIEHRWGHRTITHSWVFIVLSCILFSPLLFFKKFLIYSCLILGVISHIMIDMANTSGVTFFYPDTTRYVFPAEKTSRIEVGSKKEFILLAILIFITTITTPISYIGYKSLFYRLSQNPYGAVEEAQKWSDEFLLSATIKGIWKESQLPVNENFKVLAVQGNGILITKNNKVFYISYNPQSSIIINKIWIAKEKKIEKLLIEKKFDYILFDSIEIPENSIISGYLFYEGYEGIQDVVYGYEEREYRTIRIDPRIGNKLIISYCPAEVLKKMKNKGLYISHNHN
jgi:inner membrane protein